MEVRSVWSSVESLEDGAPAFGGWAGLCVSLESEINSHLYPQKFTESTRCDCQTRSHLVGFSDFIHTENETSKSWGRLQKIKYNNNMISGWEMYILDGENENVALELVSFLWWQAAVKTWWKHDKWKSWNVNHYILFLLTGLWWKHHCCIWVNR